MRSILLVLFAVNLLLLAVPIPNAVADGPARQVCDVRADYFLGAEDYAQAIRFHVEFLRGHPDDALAHYHLGFALGMAGDRTDEIREYRRAEALGLTNWDLLLNLGLAEAESGDVAAATDSLRRAVILGESHPEAHFNLALVDERRGMLSDAEQETLTSLRLNPAQPEARNLLGVIYAQEGQTLRASLVWSELVREAPEYQSARANLAIMGSQRAAAHGETATVDLPPTVASGETAAVAPPTQRPPSTP